MFGITKYFKIYIAFILAASVISFNGSYNTEATNNITVTNFTMSVADTFTLAAHPGPANNGGSPGWAMFLDLIAGTRDITVLKMSTSSNAAANVSYSVEVLTRIGTALGGPVGSGPGSSMTGWTSLDTVPVMQGTTGSGISLIFEIPPILVGAGDTVGVALRFFSAGPRYFGTGSGAPIVYSDTNLKLVTGDVRSAPFTPTGSYFSPRQLTGVVKYLVSTTTGIINTGNGIPYNYSLSQNYPNPFNPQTKIKFQIPNAGFVKIAVYDILGKEVAVPLSGQLNAGTYELSFDADALPSGTYFYRISSGSYTETKKMVFLK